MADRDAHEIADAIVDGLDNASKTPPIFNAAWLREAIAAAIMSEREACAQIAEEQITEPPDERYVLPLTRHVYADGPDIAAAIRSRTPPGETP